LSSFQTGSTMSQSPTAAVLLIGDEVLSGRTKDKNLGFIADYLTAVGIDLKEARVVADDEDDIIAAVNALRARTSSRPVVSVPPMMTSPQMPWPRPSA
jgi:molybdopterin-biosynthesis enzyme MoeA-like protein